MLVRTIIPLHAISVCCRVGCRENHGTSTRASDLNHCCRQFVFGKNSSCLWSEGASCPLIFIALFVEGEIWSRCSRLIAFKLITTWRCNSFWWPWSPFSQARQLPFSQLSMRAGPGLHLGPNLDSARTEGVRRLALLLSSLLVEARMGFYRPWNVDFPMTQTDVTMWWFNPAKRQWNKIPPCLHDFSCPSWNDVGDQRGPGKSCRR